MGIPQCCCLFLYAMTLLWISHAQRVPTHSVPWMPLSSRPHLCRFCSDSPPLCQTDVASIVQSQHLPSMLSDAGGEEKTSLFCLLFVHASQFGGMLLSEYLLLQIQHLSIPSAPPPHTSLVARALVQGCPSCPVYATWQIHGSAGTMAFLLAAFHTSGAVRSRPSFALDQVQTLFAVTVRAEF